MNFGVQIRNSNPLEKGDKINITLVINQSIRYKNDTLYNLTKRPKIFSFAKNMNKNIGIYIRKNLRSKYSQKRLDIAKQSITDSSKTASKRLIQRSAEVTDDLIRNKIADKITYVSKTSSENNSETNEE